MTANDYKFCNNSLDLSQYLNTCADTKSLSLEAFLNLLIGNVGNNSDKCDVWSDILLDLIDNNVINKSVLGGVRDGILSITISKSQSHLLANRVLSCKMLAKVCLLFNEEEFVTKIIDSVTRLSNDLQPSVRAHISKQLSLLSQNLSSETIRDRIVPLWTQLKNDREVIVRIAAIESIIELIPRLDQQFIKNEILPKIVVFFNSALETNEKSLGLIFMNFGKLCQTLPKNMISTDKWFLDYYFNVFLVSNDLQMKSKDIDLNERDIHCRNLLALFLPILLHIYGPNESLNSVLNFLCCDLDITVVRTIVSVFPQISNELKSGHRLYPKLSKLLSQANIILIKELMPFLSQLLIDAIKLTPNENKGLLFDDMTRNLVICENTISVSLDWRLHISLLKSLTEIMMLLPLSDVKSHFIPLLMKRIVTSRQIPVRIESSRCLLCLFRDLPILLKDINIFKWFVTTLCYGKSCSQRMLFLNICQLINELCDMKTTVKYILDPMLSLCADKVPNIRLNVCNKLKDFKSLLQSPDICGKIIFIKEIFREMLAKERDKDVIQSIHQMVHQLNWSSDFDDLIYEGVTPHLDHLKIETNSEVNNNIIDGKDLNSLKVKSCLPQLIRSQTKAKCLPTNCFSQRFASIASKIPKPITKRNSWNSSSK